MIKPQPQKSPRNRAGSSGLDSTKSKIKTHVKAGQIIAGLRRTRQTNVPKDRFKTSRHDLTCPRHALMMQLPLQPVRAGICNPNIGHPRPLIHVVFLCPSKTQAALRRLFSVMVGCIGQPLKRLAGAYAGIANPIQSTARRFATKGGGLSLLHRIPL